MDTTTEASRPTIWSDEFAAGIRRVRHAADAKGSRPILATLAIVGNDRGLTVVGCDNYRIAEQTLAEDESWGYLGTQVLRLPDVDVLLAFLGAIKRQRVELGVAIRREAIAELVVETKDENATSVSLTTWTQVTYPAYLPLIDDTRAQAKREVAIRPAFLLETLKALGKDAPYVEFLTQPDQPFQPTALRAAGYIEVIMPVRTAGDWPRPAKVKRAKRG